MKWRLFGGLAIVLACAANGVSDSPLEDIQRMNGAWDSFLLEAGGKALSEQERDGFKMKLVIHGNNYAFFMEEKLFISGRLVIDPSKKPRAIDAIPGGGPHRGKTQPGIYKFEGDDLVFVFAEPGKHRPTEFKTRPGTREMLILYKRQAK